MFRFAQHDLVHLKFPKTNFRRQSVKKIAKNMFYCYDFKSSFYHVFGELSRKF